MKHWGHPPLAAEPLFGGARWSFGAGLGLFLEGVAEGFALSKVSGVSTCSPCVRKWVHKHPRASAGGQSCRAVGEASECEFE